MTDALVALWGRIAISILVTAGFVAAVFTLMTVSFDFKAIGGQAFLVLIGVLSQSFAQVTAYWLGSSAGSAEKASQLAAIAAAKPETQP